MTAWISAGRSEPMLTVNVKKEDLVEKVRAATDGHMVDVVIEAVGKAAVWDDIVSIHSAPGAGRHDRPFCRTKMYSGL